MQGTGWIPDYKDTRDWTTEHPKVNPLLSKIGFYKARRQPLPPSVDISMWFPPVLDQNPLNACTVQTGVGLYSYFVNKAYRRNLECSRLFLYKVSRNLSGIVGDNGGYLRTTMEGMRLFGCPPEKYWPYYPPLVDIEPPPFCYALANNYKAISYYRIDSAGKSNKEVLSDVKTLLELKLPTMFGLALYSSLYASTTTGDIPYPFPGEQQIGLHALVACGYDDGKIIRNFNPLTGQLLVSRGGVRIRNSWGVGWGEAGYGWLPYDYILTGLTSDWWSLIKSDFVDTGEFGS